MYIFMPVTPGWCVLYAFFLLVYGWVAWLVGRWSIPAADVQHIQPPVN